MQSSERRQKIGQDLERSCEPVSASLLSRQYGVSRQVIVGDIALLRASGLDIQATPRGYVMVRPTPEGYIGTLACRHAPDQMQQELYTVIDLGGSLIDVIIDHPVYGQLAGQLQIRSRYDADEFLQKIQEEHAQLLSQITDGIHLHTVHCPDEATFKRIMAALERKQILYEK